MNNESMTMMNLNEQGCMGIILEMQSQRNKGTNAEKELNYSRGGAAVFR